MTVSAMFHFGRRGKPSSKIKIKFSRKSAKIVFSESSIIGFSGRLARFSVNMVQCVNGAVPFAL